MSNPIVLFLAYAVIFGALDFVWLTTMGDRFYRRELGDLMLATPNWTAAILFYVVYLVGMMVFVGLPANGDWSKALWLGALFGFFAYATYDLTNLATIRGFTPTLVAVDMAWGTLASGAASGLAVWIASRFA